MTNYYVKINKTKATAMHRAGVHVYALPNKMNAEVFRPWVVPFSVEFETAVETIRKEACSRIHGQSLSYYVAKCEMPELLNVNCNGNKKLRNTDKVRFIIWNLPAVTTCPFKTAMCEASCYARKAEKCYPTCLPSRERNYTEARRYSSFVTNMIYTLETKLASRGFRGKKAVFRIHESGDFFNMAYTYAWRDIARHFENDSRIIFQTYTKSIPFFITAGYLDDSFPKNFIVRASLWDDTAPDLRELSKSFPIYTALTRERMNAEKESGHSFVECRCNDCATCLACYTPAVRDIICEIH